MGSLGAGCSDLVSQSPAPGQLGSLICQKANSTKTSEYAGIGGANDPFFGKGRRSTSPDAYASSWILAILTSEVMHREDLPPTSR